MEIKGLELDKLNPQNFGGMCSRSAIVQISKREDGGIPTIATTDAPATIIDWERWDYVREILPMRYCELPNNNKAVLLDAHSRMSVENVLGSAKNWNVTEKELLCDIFISDAEEDVKQKIAEGHLDSVSIGYMTDPKRTVEIPKGAAVTIDGVDYKNEFTDDMPLLVRTYWKIKELSLVPIGADEAAKLKKAALQNNLRSDQEIISKLNEANEKIKELEITINHKGGSSMEPVEKTPGQILKEERLRVSAIEANAQRFAGNVTNIRELKEKAIQDGTTELEFNGILLRNFNQDKPLETPLGDLDLPKSDLEQYSLMRAINAQIDKDWSKAPHEKKVSDAISKKSGQPAKGFFVPQQILNKGVISAIEMNQRTAMTTTNAANLIPTIHADNMWIAMLRNKMVCRQAGAKVLSGLQGNLDIPKALSVGTFHWVAEQGTGTQTNFAPTKLSLTPKDGWAQQIYGRRTFLQTSPSVEALMFEDLNALCALGLDYAGLEGPGTLSPTGILHTNNIGSVAFASAGVLTWAKMVEFETDVEVANAEAASMYFVTNPRVKGAAKTTLKSSGVAGYIMEGKEINGYPVLSTNQISAGNIIFGDFSQLIFAEWGLVDIQVNPYNDNGDVKLTLFVTADVGVRQPGAFSASINAEA